MDELIHTVVKDAFRMLIEAMDENSGQKLLFPHRRNGMLRCSEQEFKHMFIKTLEETEEGIKYSVETPTMRGYVFSKKAEPRVDNKHGTSGNIDLCIHKKVNNEWQRLYMIEFKANNVSLQDMKKDLLKLCVDLPEKGLNKENYFIHIIYSANDRTLESLQEKYGECSAFISEQAAMHYKGIIVYLLFVSGIGKDQGPCYCLFNLGNGFNINNCEFQKI